MESVLVLVLSKGAALDDDGGGQDNEGSAKKKQQYMAMVSEQVADVKGCLDNVTADDVHKKLLECAQQFQEGTLDE